MSTINEALSHLDVMESDAHERFEQLARRIAAGEKPEADEVLGTILGASKSNDDLASLAKTFHRREQLRSGLAELDILRRRVEEIKRELDARNAAHERVVEAHREDCRPLRHELSNCQGRVTELRGAKQELLTSCQSPSLNSPLKYCLDGHGTVSAHDDATR